MPKFTQYIKQVKYVPPELLDALAKTLRTEMNKRGLWTAPPAWLGYENWNRWDETIGKYKDGALKKYSDAFIDLLFECYEYLFLKQRLLHLQNAMKQSQNIDGLVIRNIENFLTEKRRRYDSVGYNVARHARDAVQCAMDKGILKARGLNDKKKVHNPTRLTFSSTHSTTPSEQGDIFEVLRNNQTWINILPKLAGKSEKVQERLCEIVCQLQGSGINCFLFKSLVDAMKEHVQENIKYNFAKEKALEIQQTAPNESEVDETEYAERFQEIVQFIQPDNSDEEQESFRDLCNKLRDAIDNSSVQKKVRERLYQILIELETAIETETEIPSLSELSRRLNNVAISTIHNDMERFQQLLEQIKLKDLE